MWSLLCYLGVAGLHPHVAYILFEKGPVNLVWSKQGVTSYTNFVSVNVFNNGVKPPENLSVGTYNIFYLKIEIFVKCC